MAHVLDTNHTLAVCELALLHFRFCAFSEGLAGCLARLGGAARITFALPSKCTKARAWRRLLEDEKASGSQSGSSRNIQGLPAIHLRVPRRLFVDMSQPVVQRLGDALPKSYHGGPVVCGGCRRFSLGYAFPREDHLSGEGSDEFFSPPAPRPSGSKGSAREADEGVTRVSRAKVFSFLKIVPREFTLGFTKTHRSFAAEDEWLMTQLYRHSYYVATQRRGGWDARRHHEILFAGAVPYFVDMTDMPPTVMPALPRSLIASAMALDGPNRIGTFSYRWGRKKGFVHESKTWQHGRMRQWITYIPTRMPSFDARMLNKTAYFDAADRIFTSVKERMTTDRLAAHVLRSLNVTNPRRVLFFFEDEYQSQMLLHGLADLGVSVDVVGLTPDSYLFKRPYRAFKTYEEVEAWWPRDAALQGNGWYFQMRVDPRPVTCLGRIDDNATLTELLTSYFPIKRTGTSPGPYSDAAEPSDSPGRRNDSTDRSSIADPSESAKLPTGRYDIVIYSKASQMPVADLPLYATIRGSGFSAKRIVLLDYLDFMSQPHRTPCHSGVLFKREFSCHTPKWL